MLSPQCLQFSTLCGDTQTSSLPQRKQGQTGFQLLFPELTLPALGFFVCLFVVDLCLIGRMVSCPQIWLPALRGKASSKRAIAFALKKQSRAANHTKMQQKTQLENQPGVGAEPTSGGNHQASRKLVNGA